MQIDFGGKRCTELGQCILHVPLASIFGTAIPEALQDLPGLQVDLDLFQIKEDLMIYK